MKKEELDKLLSRIQTNDSSLKELNLFFGQSDDINEILLIAEALKKNTVIRTVGFRLNFKPFRGDGDAYCVAIAEVIKANTSITEITLSLPFNRSAVGFNPISEALKVNKNLLTLNATELRIKEKKDPWQKREIRMDTEIVLAPGLTEEELDAFAEAIAGNTTLLQLKIGSIEMVERLVHVLNINKTLTWLECSNNISPTNTKQVDICQKLLAILKVNRTLISLPIERIDYDSPPIPTIAEKIFSQLAYNHMLAETLLLAAKSGNLERVQELVTEKANLNYQNGEGNTALHLAALAGHAEIVAFLLAQKRQLKLRNKKDQLPQIEGLIKNTAPNPVVINESITDEAKAFLYLQEKLDPLNAFLIGLMDTVSLKAMKNKEAQSLIIDASGLEENAKIALKASLEEIFGSEAKAMSSHGFEIAWSSIKPGCSKQFKELYPKQLEKLSISEEDALKAAYDLQAAILKELRVPIALDIGYEFKVEKLERIAKQEPEKIQALIKAFTELTVGAGAEITANELILPWKSLKPGYALQMSSLLEKYLSPVPTAGLENTSSLTRNNFFEASNSNSVSDKAGNNVHNKA